MKGFGEQHKSKKKEYKKNKISNEQIINKAINFHVQGNISEAVKYYQYCINQGFDDHRIFSNYGVILQSIGKLKEAEFSYRKAIELKPDYAEAYSNLGIILKDVGKLQDAEFSYRKAIELKPDYAEAYSNLGIILKDVGKLQDAEFSTRKAIKINPHLAEAHYNLGNILKNLGKLQDAELSYHKAIELKPHYAEAHYNLGNIFKDLDRLQDAELSYRKAIELKPHYADAFYNLGNILKNLGKLQDAEFSTRKAIEINPDFVEAHSNLGIILKDLGRLQDAELSYLKAIDLKPDYAEAYSNLGIILKDLGRLQDAEFSTRKAVEINPHLAEAYSNLGNILKDLGRLQDAELLIRKAIEINPHLAVAYFSLTNFQYSNNGNKKWQEKLFSEDLLINKLPKEKVNIYFARANVHHKAKRFKESSKCLMLGNKLKLNINSSNSEMIINKSKSLLIEADKEEIYEKDQITSSISIFIVGMPRSGSTLLESILSMRNDVHDLGEVNILEESFLEFKRLKSDQNLADIYQQKIKEKTDLNVTTNKNLFNYQYTGIIAKHMPKAKIIHCFRNPLDNILSIYRANFYQELSFASSLVDCANIYLNQDELMNQYKNRFRSKIFDLNYDSLVINPNKEIKSLINWLGWEWKESYLSPHLNIRSVSTASNVEVRSPINSKSIGKWKNYKTMLKPVMEIITKKEKYKELKY